MSKQTGRDPTKTGYSDSGKRSVKYSQDGLSDFTGSFDRYGWDILAVFLFALCFIGFIGLIGLSQGSLITPLAILLKKGFGWGAWLFVLFLGLSGLIVLRRNHPVIPSLSLGRIIALEGLAFVILALLAIFSGMNLEAAESGKYGGVIGWGLAMLSDKFLPPFLSAVVFLALAVVLALFGFGMTDRLKAFIAKTAQSDQYIQPVTKANTSEKSRNSSVDNLQISQVGDPKVQPSLFAEEEGLPDPNDKSRDDRLPPLNLLRNETVSAPDKNEIKDTAVRIEQCLLEFGVPAKVIGYRVGPTVTQFAVEPGFIEKSSQDGEPSHQKVRVSQISNLSKDLALALSAERLRIQAPVPGHSYVGIEVPNQLNAAVRLRAILESESFQKLSSPLALAIGRDVSGAPVVADLSRMPHMLIAGTTGSGKSVCIAAITTCLAMNNSPTDLRMVMLDPKMVELVRFNGLPHLHGKVETDPARMIAVLQWALAEMDTRYRLMEGAHCRDLETYNRKMQRKKQPLIPRIVVLIDELADLMMANPEQTEFSLVRLAQMARATGIHLVVATQRPSTNVVTGLIKANFPARMAFTVASSVDSRVILDTNGAETLLGRGDLLFLNPEAGVPLRAQGVIVTDPEIEKVINFWQRMSPASDEPPPWEELATSQPQVGEGSDDLIEQAIDIVRHARHASASMLQRRMRIGYPRAARLMDELEEMGVIGHAQTGGKEREVLIPPEDDEVFDS
jgi:S-DNA-T family DNA segregation ATPase FtsK/SpoIIIE